MITTKKLGLALVLSLIGVACAAPPIPDSGADEEEGSEDAITPPKPKKKTTPPKAPSDTTPPTDQTSPPANPPADPPPGDPPPGDPPGTPPPGGGSCGGTANGEACFTCCDQASGGELVKADEAFGACACGGGQCASACGSNFCNGAQESAACGTCLEQKCEPVFQSACTSAGCKAGLQCLETSCAGKQ